MSPLDGRKPLAVLRAFEDAHAQISLLMTQISLQLSNEYGIKQTKQLIETSLLQHFAKQNFEWCHGEHATSGASQ